MPRRVRHIVVACGILVALAVATGVHPDQLKAQVALPVFPGAEGFGTTTPAGRGGAVLAVTNLNDSGPGSLRAALTTAEPRTVIFEISGTLTLTSGDLTVTSPYLTVAGQTAPSPGITIRGGGIRIETHDVLVQHLRVRPGDVLANGVYRGNAGGFMVLGREGTPVDRSQTYNVVLDHVTASWATDQDMSTYYPVHDVTVSDSLISEGLRDGNAPNAGQCHACGFLEGEHGWRIAIVRTLFAHNIHRFPEIKGDTETALVNNVAYDNQQEVVDMYDYAGDGPSKATIIGNVHIPGPSTILGGLRNPFIYLNANLKPGSQVYQSDNVSPWVLSNNVVWFSILAPTPPVWSDSIKVMPSSEVESYLKAHAGARPADRDPVDLRIIGEVTNRTGRIIDRPGDVGGYPDLAQNTRRLAIPRDPAGDDNHDGYTNLEDWLAPFTAAVENVAPGSATTTR